MATSPSSTCGVLGLDAGWFGRWSRLAWGLLILFPFVIRTLHDLRTNGFSASFYGQALLYILLIAVACTAVYTLLGERLFARANPCLNTAIRVVPAFTLAWWNLLFAPMTGLALPVP